MSATSGNLGSSPTQTTNPSTPDPLTVLAALAEPVRWSIIQLLASGRALSGTDIAAELGRSPDAVNKHLRLLRETGVLRCELGADRRYYSYKIPAPVRATRGLLDFGCCTLRVSEARPDDVGKD